MKTILQSWNFTRLIRFILGLAVLLQGIFARDNITIIFGIAIGGMALINVGCCGANGCSITTPAKTKIIQDEELDTKK